MPVETRSAKAAKSPPTDGGEAPGSEIPPVSNQEAHDLPPNPVRDLVAHLEKCSIQADSPASPPATSSEEDLEEKPIQTAVEFEAELVRMVNLVYGTLGNAQSEGAYQRALAIEIKQRGLTCLSEFEIPIEYKGQRIGSRRADLIVQLGEGSRYILELKAVQNLKTDHLRQLKYYMVHFHVPLGLLINFPKAQTFPDVVVDEDGGGAINFDVDKLQGETELRDQPTRKARASKVAPAPEIHRVQLLRN
jgi:GxxExxY protein